MALFEVMMLFQEQGELLLLEDGMSMYHLRRDGQLTIHELVALNDAGRQRVLAALEAVPGALNLTARRPDMSPDEGWLGAAGFRVFATDKPRGPKRGRKRGDDEEVPMLNIWRLELPRVR